MKSDLVDCHAVEHGEDEDVLLSEGRVRSPLSRAEEVGLNDLVHVWIDFGASLGSRSPIGTQFNFSENFRRPTFVVGGCVPSEDLFSYRESVFREDLFLYN